MTNQLRTGQLPLSESYREKIIRDYNTERILREIEFGHCFCGCGKPTPLATKSLVERQWLRGFPLRFINTHRIVHRNKIEQPINQELRAIPLTKGQVAIVSAHRYEYLSKFNWRAYWSDYGYYAVRHEKQKDGKRITIWMHREILGLKPGDPRTGDHINPSDTLNNSDTNLQIADNNSEQCQHRRKPKHNTSGYKGVTFVESMRSRPWRVSIRVQKKRIDLGYYSTALEAAHVYDCAAQQHHGRFAVLNFPHCDV